MDNGVRRILKGEEGVQMICVEYREKIVVM